MAEVVRVLPAGTMDTRNACSAPCSVEVFGDAGDALQRAARTADALDVMLEATEGWVDG